ncbi:hypothetical protein F2Q69_00041706 [Brassica cretica]|uniref:Uncharacterized protein n=1 Tax=Brassica cretica TaxID=69181 RepID=A0A8S9N7G3_BRACR|nr:hypothetical protein F2Q69_00041706 [Brassica cretica]
MHEKKKNKLDGREWKPTTEKPKLKLETINNLPRVQSTHTEKTLSKPGVANMAKGRATRDVISDERYNEMRGQRDKKRQNEINKPWSHSHPMKKS